MYSDDVESVIRKINTITDYDVLIGYVNRSYDVAIMRAAANRAYELYHRKPVSIEEVGE